MCQRLESFSALEEEVTINEQKRTGLRAPKMSFMLLATYEKKFGKPPPQLIKKQCYEGRWYEGVDVVKEEDRCFQHCS